VHETTTFLLITGSIGSPESTVYTPKGILIGSSVLAQLMIVTEADRHASKHTDTHTHTLRPRYICSNKPHLWTSRQYVRVIRPLFILW